MLSDLFQQELARLASQSASVQQQRNARDAFIVVQFPLLDASFAGTVDSTIGHDSHLTVTHIPATDHFTNHTFTTLNKTITAVQSTLYGSPETVTFTPALQSLDSAQFGVISVATDALPDSVVADSGEPLFTALLQQGIWMRGSTVGSLVIPYGANFTAFSGELLENFLAALFIRS
jgi:hypothetical protein